VAIRKLFGWELFPDASTFGKMFKRFNFGHCHELSEAEARDRRNVFDIALLASRLGAATEWLRRP